MNKIGDLIDETEWFGCIDHLIQLVTKPVFDGEGIAELMSRVRELCGAFNSSSQLEERMKNIQTSVWPDKTPLTLLQDVVTRWLSTYQQIEITQVEKCSHYDGRARLIPYFGVY